MRWYAILFWLWFLVSLVALVVRRRNRSSGAVDASTTSATTGSVDPLARRWAPPPADPDAPLAPVVDTAAIPDAAARLDTLGPAAEDPATTPVQPAALATLPELLAGITLPCDLVPLTQGATVDLANHVVLATERAGGRDVREALIAEIERLGFVVSPTGNNTFTATCDRGQLSVEVHPSAGGVVDAGAPRFPTAEPSAVVVELRTP